MSFPLFSIVQRLGSNQEKGERAWREIQPATPLCVLYGKNFTLTWPSAKLSGRNGSLLFEAFSRFCDFLLSLPLFHFSHLASILSFSLYLFPPSSIDRSMPDWMFHSKSVKSKLLLLLLLFRFLSFFLSLPFSKINLKNRALRSLCPSSRSRTLLFPALCQAYFLLFFSSGPLLDIQGW